MGAFVAGDISSLTTSVTTLTGVTWPSHTTDHLGILAHGYGDSTNTGTMDSGFTNIADLTDTNLRAIIGKRIPSVMTGSESGDVTLTTTTGARQVGALAVYSGYTDVQQIVNQPETSGTAQTTHACPAITPQVAGSGFVMVYMDRVSTGNTTATPPTGFTLREEFGTSGTGGIFMQVADDLSGTHGLTPFTPASWTVAVGSTSAIVFLIELTPEPITGSAAVTQAAETSTASGTLGYSGTVTRTQAAQTSSASGGLGYTGTLARTQAAQTSSAAGSVSAPPAVSAPSTANRSPFRIQIYDTSFAKQGEVNSYQSVEFTLRLNAVGSWTIKLNPSDQAVQELVQKRRRITVDYKGVRILSGPVELRRQVRDENGLRVYEFGGPDDLIWLADRLAYPNPGGTIPGDNIVFTQTATDDIRRGNGETVIKGYVTANAVTRLAVPGLTVATNLNRGSTTTGSARMISVLDTVAPVANGSGLALSLKQVAAGLVFDVFAPTAQPVRLSENLKNLKAWEYVEEAPGATRVVVGGQGDGVAKKFLKRTLSTSETDWETREQFYDATDVDTDADLPIRGGEYLGQNAPQAGFSVTPEDSDSMSFAVNYNLGDVVTVEVTDGVFESDTVKQVVLTHAVGGLVTVQPAIGNLDAADKTNAIYRAFKDLLRRMARQERKS